MDIDGLDELDLQGHLVPGETLLWTGRPEAGLKLRGSDALFIPFSLLWAGFAVFWEYSVLTTNAPWFFRLWGIPFVLIGLYMVVGRFFLDAWLRARTVYGVSDQRILIFIGTLGLSPSLTSLSLRTLREVTVYEQSDGSGTITFGPFPSISWGRRSGGPSQDYPAFEFIPEVRSVAAMIQAAQTKAGTGTEGKPSGLPPFMEWPLEP